MQSLLAETCESKLQKGRPQSSPQNISEWWYRWLRSKWSNWHFEFYNVAYLIIPNLCFNHIPYLSCDSTFCTEMNAYFQEHLQLLRSCSIGSLEWKLPTSVDDLQLSKGRFETFDVAQIDGSNVTDRPPFTFLIYVVYPAECFPKPVTNNANRAQEMIISTHFSGWTLNLANFNNNCGTSEWHIEKTSSSRLSCNSSIWMVSWSA